MLAPAREGKIARIRVVDVCVSVCVCERERAREREKERERESIHFQDTKWYSVFCKCMV